MQLQEERLPRLLGVLQCFFSVRSWFSDEIFFLSLRRAPPFLQGLMQDRIPAIFAAVFECTLSMITKNFEDFPEHRVAFFNLLRATNQHCFPGWLQCSQHAHRAVPPRARAIAPILVQRHPLTAWSPMRSPHTRSLPPDPGTAFQARRGLHHLGFQAR